MASLRRPRVEENAHERFLLVVALLLTMPSLAAQAGPREDSRAGIARCDALTDDRSWLDCVYGAVQPMRARLGLSPAPDFQQRLATGTTAGPGVRTVPTRPMAAAPMAPASVQAVHRGKEDWVHLAAYTFNRHGMFTVTLPDGTVWQQDDSDVNYAHWKDSASHYVVSVGEGISGRGTLELQNDGNEYIVRRIR
jgi:hypothetical protein